MRERYPSISFHPFIHGSIATSAIAYGLIFGTFSALILVSANDLINGITFLAPDDSGYVSGEEMAANIIGSLFFAPPVETLIFQVFIIEGFGKKIRPRIYLAAVLSVISFSAVHLISGGAEQSIRMVILGSILTAVYCWSRLFSLQAAFVTTLVTHAVHNGIILTIMLYMMLNKN